MELMYVWLGVVALMVASLWQVFAKAGEAGWKCLIPIYGAVVFMKIVGRPWWWVLWMLVPVLGIIPAVVTSLDLARVFGKGAGFGVGIMFLGFIFVPMLAFGGAEYVGPDGSSPAPMRKAA